MRIMFLKHSYKCDNPEREAALVNSYASPGTTVEIHCPDDLGGREVLDRLSENKVLSGLHHMVWIPALVKKIMEAEQAGFDAVVQSNTFDPGVDAGRLAVRIPVVGLLRSSLLFAASLCDRFAVIVPLESHIPYVFRLIETYRMGHFVTDIRTIKTYEDGDLSKYHDLIAEQTIAEARKMVAGGAQAISPLGGKIIPYEVTPEELEPQIGVPVINTKAVGIRFAELMVSSGMTHSSKAYPYFSGIKPEDVAGRSGCIASPTIYKGSP